MSERPLISLVMIVKNEAAILRETLERVRPIVDEWVIVDTGSTDGHAGDHFRVRTRQRVGFRGLRHDEE